MSAIAHNPAFAKKVGVPQSVGKDFNNADKGKTFKQGGETMATKKKMDPKLMARMMAAKRQPRMEEPMMGNMAPASGMGGMMKKGGSVKKMASGGEAYVGSRLNMPSNTRLGKLSPSDTKDVNRYDRSESGKEQAAARKEGIVAKRTKMQDAGIAEKNSDMMPGSEYKKGGSVKKMAMGGITKDDTKKDKAIVKKAVGMHDRQMHGGKKTDLATLKKGGMAMKKMAGGGLASGHKSADGIASKGKTRGKFC